MRQRIRLVFQKDETLSLLSEHASQHAEPSGGDRAVALEECLQKLSAKNRELIEQRYGSRGSMQDFAEQSGRSGNAIYKMLQRIRESLHHCITRRLEKEGYTA